ncbi:NADH oxidase [Meira miltonrushii]|uniref:NADH oxidase n=1 Tax=Meira miltonrushii TaxID=1280837 RepID=A0A316V8C6_9BASI|nr:NADH oxidase [Meira miltonrushii]PWN32731.1 NADH oxidase [Meira miltonrushii]
MSTISIRRQAEKPSDPSILGDKIQLPFSGKTAKSRFMKGAMTEYQSSWDQKDLSKRGIPSEGLIRVYEEWGRGGFGIVLSGNTIVDEINLEGPGNPIMNKRVADQPERAKAFQRLAAGAKAEGSLFLTQLSHGGRQVAEGLNPNPVSASDVKLDDRMGHSFGKPTPLSKEGIQEVVQNFAFAAKYAYDNGSDGVQLHAAHGYLLAQFLAQTTNKRTDEYGGSLENRARIIYEIIQEIRKQVPDPSFILGIKINSVEFQTGGFTPEECREVCAHLEKLGVDVIELSGGTYEELAFSHKRESTIKREAFFLEFSEIIRKGIKKSTIWTTGGFRTAKGMIDAIQSGSTDGIGLGRPVTQEFDLPKKLISGEAVAATKTLLDENNFMITNVASGTQMQQIGNKIQPFDQANEEDHEHFNQTMQAWMKNMGEKGKEGIVEAGYPKLEGQPLKSF